MEISSYLKFKNFYRSPNSSEYYDLFCNPYVKKVDALLLKGGNGEDIKNNLQKYFDDWLKLFDVIPLEKHIQLNLALNWCQDWMLFLKQNNIDKRNWLFKRQTF